MQRLLTNHQQITRRTFPVAGSTAARLCFRQCWSNGFFFCPSSGLL